MAKKKRDVLDIATNPDPERERKMADEELSFLLLSGQRCDEPAARKALARRVRDAMGGFSGELLALAIDPDTKSRYMGMMPTRRIKFESVRRGRKPTWRRDLRIMHRIRRELGRTNKLEAAYQAAMNEFGVSRATAQAVWKRHQKAMQDALASK